MIILLIAGLYGVWRFRSKPYWQWLGILAAWMIVMQTLFYADGTLEDPSGDGYLTRYIRAATADGVGMGVFAIVFIVLYWGVVIYLISRLRKAGKAGEELAATNWQEDQQEVPTSRKLLETLGLLAVTAGWVYLFFVVPHFAAQEAKQPITSEAGVKDAPDPIAGQLVQSANEANKDLPKTIDAITRLDRVSADGRTLTYHYTITRRDASDEDFRAFIEKNAVPKACANQNMAAEMRDYGITYRYSYTMPNQAETIEVDANWPKCAK